MFPTAVAAAPESSPVDALVASHGSELAVIVRSRIQAFETPIVLVSSLGRFVGRQDAWRP